MILDANNQPALFIDTHAFDNGLKLMEHSYVGNAVMQRMEHALFNNPQRVVWAGDYADDEPDTQINLYALAERRLATEEILPFQYGEKPVDAKWVLNHDKKLAVAIPKDELDLWIVHPLSLLTCEGNGRGGGDFRGDNPHVGEWARDRISVSDQNVYNFDVLEITFVED
jgi:hypothetical protein